MAEVSNIVPLFNPVPEDAPIEVPPPAEHEAAVAADKGDAANDNDDGKAEPVTPVIPDSAPPEPYNPFSNPFPDEEFQGAAGEGAVASAYGTEFESVQHVAAGGQVSTALAPELAQSAARVVC